MSETENRLFLGGWICLWRKIANSTLWLDEKFTKGQAWVDLLLLAQGAFNSEVRGGQYREFKPGVVYWSITALADRWKWNRRTAWSFLQSLEKAGMLTLDSQCRKGTIITISNWGMYQHGGGKTPRGSVQSLVQSPTQTSSQTSTQQNDAQQGFEGCPRTASAQLTAQPSAQMTAHNITIYKQYKKKKNNNSALSPTTEPPSRAPLLIGGADDGSGKTKADIPEPWRNDFDTYEDYWRWRNQ